MLGIAENSKCRRSLSSLLSEAAEIGAGRSSYISNKPNQCDLSGAAAAFWIVIISTKADASRAAMVDPDHCCVHPHRRGLIDSGVPLLLDRLGIELDNWTGLSWQFETELPLWPALTPPAFNQQRNCYAVSLGQRRYGCRLLRGIKQSAATATTLSVARSLGAAP